MSKARSLFNRYVFEKCCCTPTRVTFLSWSKIRFSSTAFSFRSRSIEMSRVALSEDIHRNFTQPRGLMKACKPKIPNENMCIMGAAWMKAVHRKAKGW